jgi:hypothetical protein
MAYHLHWGLFFLILVWLLFYSAITSFLLVCGTATICSYAVRDIPLSMVMAGIQVLLPGGIGVQASQTAHII